MNTIPMIDSQNMPTWIAAGFIVAVISFVLAVSGIYRTNMVVLATQAEVLALNKKVEDIRKPLVAAPQSAAAATPVK